jgi:small-conductance mechanosensitive channel
MMTTRIRLIAAAALAGFLATLLHTPLLAQEQQQPPAAPTDTAAAPSGPRPIAATDIPQRAEETTTILREIRAGLVSDTLVAEIDSLLQVAVQTVAEERQRLAPDRLAGMYVGELEDLEQQWLRYQTTLDQWRGTLESQTQSVDEKRARLTDLRESWQLTSDSAAAQELPAALVERVRSQLGEIDALDAEVRRPRDRLLTLQNQIADQSIIVGEVLTSIQAARQSAQLRVLSAESPPLWGAFTEEDRQVVLPQGRAAFRERIGRVRDYVVRNDERLWVHLVLFLVIAGSLIALRRRTRQWEIDDETVRSAGFILDRPVATGFLIALLFSRALHPLAPSAFYEIIGLIAMVPLVRLVPALVPPRFVGPTYALIAIFTADTMFDVAVSHLLIKRLLLLVVTAAVLGGIAFFLRGELRSTSAERSRWQRAFQLLLRGALALLGASLIANILGWVALAELLTDGTIVAALIGLIVLLGVKAADLVLHASIHTDTLRTLRVIRDHGDEIVERAAALLHLGGVFLWLTFAARGFRLYDPLMGTLGAILTADWGLGSWRISILDILSFFLALWLGLMFARIARLTLREDVLSRMTLPRGMRETISTTAYYVILLLAFFFAAGAAGFDLTKFTILAGALGVGIGFGLQNIVNNFISGLILLFERPIQIGDTIEIENLVGSVKQIGIRASVVRTFAGAEVIVPNGDLISGRVINWTLSDRLRRIEIYVGVAYGTDVQRVMDILLEQARNHEDTLEHPEPYVLFTGFGECSLDFKLRFWTANYDRWFFTESEVKVAVNNALKEAGIEIPFPQRDLRLRSVDGAAGEVLVPGRGAATVKRSKPAPQKE